MIWSNPKVSGAPPALVPRLTLVEVGVCGYGRGEIGERGETLGHNTDKPAEEERVEAVRECSIVGYVNCLIAETRVKVTQAARAAH